MTYLESLQSKTKDELVNELYNKSVSDFADFNESDIDKHGHGKRIPYIGWFWRNTGFVNKSISIGDCGDFVGVMEHNRWGYPEREMTEPEVDKFIEYLEHVFIASETREAVIDGLWDWFQTLRGAGEWSSAYDLFEE